MGFTAFDTPRLRLRRFALADMPTLMAYRRDPTVQQFQNFGEWTEAEQRTFLAEAQLAELDAVGKSIQIAVALRERNTLVGDLYVRLTEPEQAEIGYTFDPAQRGQGYASEAVRGIFDYLFGTLNLHRIVAICATENVRSYKLMERIGMRREAEMRQSYRYSGVWRDEYMYAILREEWTIDGRS